MPKEQTAVRYDDATRARIAALIGPMSTPIHEATISDVLRAATAVGLTQLEKEYKVARPVSMADPMKPEHDADNGRLARGGGQGRRGRQGSDDQR